MIQESLFLFSQNAYALQIFHPTSPTLAKPGAVKASFTIASLHTSVLSLQPGEDLSLQE